MARPSKYVSRSDLGWGASPASKANPRSGLVIHYDSGDQRLADKPHSACLTYWRNTRNFHTGPSRGWVDIGYSWMACAHGFVLEGRGLQRQQAAQPGGNATHYSVTLATGITDDITEDQINAVRELRVWLRDDHENNGRVLKHSDFIATSCPGPKASKMVDDGIFTMAPGAISTGPEGYEHMLGLKRGDSGQAVRDLQVYLNDAGFPPANSRRADGEWDGGYGPAVSAAVLKLRKDDHGSTATNGDHISYWAMNQIRRSWLANQVRLMGLTAGGSGGSLPSTERVQINGTVEIKR